MTTIRDFGRPDAEVEHERLARLLPDGDRSWLLRMADVLPWGWVVLGMATPASAAVVGDHRYPLGIRVVHAPRGPAGHSRARHHQKGTPA